MPNELRIRKHIKTVNNWKLYGEYGGNILMKIRLEKWSPSGELETAHFLFPSDDVQDIQETLPNEIAKEIFNLLHPVGE